MATGEIIAGKYEIGGMIARGGMGSVWRARHLSLDIDVAVKLMSAGLASSPEQRVRFAREARAAAQIRSPHVVQIHDHGVAGETPYIVMELLSGEDLGARLRREKRLSPAVTAGLARQMGRGLRKAHEMGIVHRDLKPANIFLSRTDDGEELVKILDFGIARAGAAGDSTLTGELLGSPPYMSPEQARGLKSLDQRTDQWSLGVVLFRLLAGQLPFQGDQAGDVIVKICTEEAPLFSSVAPGLSRGLDAFFQRVFRRDPEQRFASIGELVDAFLEAATPGAAPRPSSPSLVEAPVIPLVPFGRTTVRMEAPRRPEGPRDGARPAPITDMSKTAPPMEVWSVLPALPFSSAPAPSPAADASAALDAATTGGGTTRPVRADKQESPETQEAPEKQEEPQKLVGAGRQGWSGVFWAGVVLAGALVGATTMLIVRTAGRSAAAGSAPVSIEIAAAPEAPLPAFDDPPSGTATGLLAPLAASAAPGARAVHTGILATGALPGGAAPTGALPTGTLRPATAKPAASHGASASPSAAAQPPSATAQQRFIYGDDE